jgi:hypothetical protein
LQHLADASCFKFRPHTRKVILQRYSYENTYVLKYTYTVSVTVVVYGIDLRLLVLI